MLYGPDGKTPISSGDKYSSVGYIREADTTRDGIRAKKDLEAHIGRWENYRRQVTHPVMGMARKGYAEIEINSSLRVIDDMIDWLLDLQEGW